MRARSRNGASKLDHHGRPPVETIADRRLRRLRLGEEYHLTAVGGLAALSLDALSSVAYGPEAIVLGLVAGGTFILQSNASAEEVWAELPVKARQTIRDRKIRFFIIDAFAVAKKNAPTPELATRMMGIALSLIHI